MEEYEKIQLPWSDWKIIKYLGGSADTKVYEIERNVSEKLEKLTLPIIIMANPNIMAMTAAMASKNVTSTLSR